MKAQLIKSSSRSVPKPRIETLSDLVFGLALSIGALTLLGNPPTTPAQIANDLMAFGFSFLLLILVWLRYTTVMSVLPVETSTTLFLNVLLLLLVSIEPYLFSLVNQFDHVAQSEIVGYASVLYSLDVAGLLVILGFFTHVAAIEEKRLISREILWKYKRIRNSLFITGALFLLMALPPFWSWRIHDTPVRLYAWYLPLLVLLIRKLSERHTYLTKRKSRMRQQL